MNEQMMSANQASGAAELRGARYSLESAKPAAAHVYEAICAVTAAMAREGIGKTRKNEQQGYRFRSVDDVYAAIGGLLAANKLCMLPRVIERSVLERPTKGGGGVLTYTTLTVEFDLVSAVDGSRHTIRTVGEAMDAADKSSNKSMSAAFKYAAFLAFQIPTEGDNDADASHHERGPLEKQLAASIDWPAWETKQVTKLRAAKTMGALSEAWHEVYEAGKTAPNGTLLRLAAEKDARKIELAPRNGETRT